MNQRVDQQVAACVRAKKLAIDHVRNPSERMPVRRIKRGERPDESRAGNTAIHHWIFLDIRGVIESDELMPDHLRINRKRHYCQSTGDEEIHSTERCTLTIAGCGRSFASDANATLLSFSHSVFGHSVKETASQLYFYLPTQILADSSAAEPLRVSELASTCSFAEIAAGSKAFKRFHVIEVGLRLPQPPLQ
jgi:hypothetical protein